MSDLYDLPNIGKELARQLREVGFENAEQLKSVGSRQAWLAINAIDPSACINRLCALEGVIQGVR